MKNKPLVSFVIPTRNSSRYLEVLLKSILNQKFKNVEIIVVDNLSSDDTLKISLKYKVKLITYNGNPPQVSKQRNIGALKSKGEFIFFIDHDMELSRDFLKYFSKYAKKYQKINAWYIHEEIISKNMILSVVRNLESLFVDGTAVSAARLIKRTTFLTTKGFDQGLSKGPTDWDFNNQLITNRAQFGIFNRNIYHHEEDLTLSSYIHKKTGYFKNAEKYKSKWKRKNKYIYDEVVNKQFSPYYRLIKIFIENGKWKMLISHMNEYFLFLLIKIILGTIYLFYLFSNRFKPISRYVILLLWN